MIWPGENSFGCYFENVVNSYNCIKISLSVHTAGSEIFYARIRWPQTGSSAAGGPAVAGRVNTMSRMNHDKTKSFFGGRGFYIALVLCLAVVGVAGYLALVQQAEVAREDRDTPVVQQEPVEDIQRAQVPEPVEETLKPEELLPQVCSPLDGTTVTVFSMTELLYDETMADWRTHSGIDIKAEEGDAVKTAADGVVKEVRYDDLMGVTVVITHEDGYETQYSCLQQEPPVEQGKTVKAGDIIGLVGSTASAEADVGPHLHFSVSKDGKVIDPAEYVQ